MRDEELMRERKWSYGSKGTGLGKNRGGNTIKQTAMTGENQSVMLNRWILWPLTPSVWQHLTHHPSLLGHPLLPQSERQKEREREVERGRTNADSHSEAVIHSHLQKFLLISSVATISSFSYVSFCIYSFLYHLGLLILFAFAARLKT